MIAKRKEHWAIVERWFSQRHTWPRIQFGAWLLMLFICGAALPYILINRFSQWQGRSTINIHSPLDDAVPFVPWMIVFYISFYAYFPIMMWMGAAEHRRTSALIAVQELIVATWLAFGVFLLLPVHVDLRGEVSANSFDFIINLLHALDSPYNAWPSLHVLQSFLVVLVARTWLIEARQWHTSLAICVWLSWVLLCLSTLLVKQHYIFDMVTGIVFGLLFWQLRMKNAVNGTQN